MTVGYTLWSMLEGALVSVTSRDRLNGLRQAASPRVVEEYSSLVAILLLLAALVLMLWWVTHKERAVARGPARDLLAEGAARRGLGSRERQILMAIVVRGKLRRNHDIFTTPDAFDAGAAKLVEECARRRTPEECDRLRAEVAGLREKIGYRTAVAGGQAKAGSSRSIPVGATIELLRRRDPGGAPVAAVVIRNDELDIAVEARGELVSQAGEPWRVRYPVAGVVWQFDSSAVSCEGNRLVLNQPEEVRVVERGVDRVTLNAPATVARFPFIQPSPAGSSGDAQVQWLELVDAIVTQMSDGGLQVNSSLSVRPGERVLLMVALAGGSGEAGRASHIVGHVGRVKHRQASGTGTLMTVELSDVADHELDELLRLAKACASHEAAAPLGRPVRQGV